MRWGGSRGTLLTLLTPAVLTSCTGCKPDAALGPGEMPVGSAHLPPRFEPERTFPERSHTSDPAG